MILEKAKKCKTSGEIDKLVLNICKQNKNLLNKQKCFIKNFKPLYAKIKIKDNHLKYLYTKYKKIIFPETLDEIFEYSKNVDELGFFCRNITKCLLIDKKGNIIEHSHLIFFTEIMMKRLLTSENLLIDGTFTFPKNFYQTIIIMFYDPLCFKMIPGIFIEINNKTLEGYSESFKFIRDYIYNYINNVYNKIKWQIFTDDLKKSLYTSFKNVFYQLENLMIKECFSLFKIIKKYLVKNRFLSNDKIHFYSYLINICYKLLLKVYIDKTIKKDIKNICIKNNIYEPF